MRLSDLGEFGLIDRIRKLAGGTGSALIGIGDDAAAIRSSASFSILVTTDLLLEGIHFDLSLTDYYSLGWKSAAVNLSDIAAMGGTPRFRLSALGIPDSVAPGQVLDFYRGLTALLRRHKTALIGGDTCSSRHGLFVSVTAIGEAKPSRIITRAGARPGDRIFVTGTLGDSAAGLELLQAGRPAARARERAASTRSARSAAGKLFEKHLRPTPRIKEGILIARSGCATAMIDLSDGLSSDLFHLCEQSRVGAEIDAGSIPCSGELKALSDTLVMPALSYALSGGEDYELLFTVPRERLAKFRSLRLPATAIGTIIEQTTISLLGNDGKKKRLERKGYEHFRGTAGQGKGRARRNAR